MAPPALTAGATTWAGAWVTGGRVVEGAVALVVGGATVLGAAVVGGIVVGGAEVVDGIATVVVVSAKGSWSSMAIAVTGAAVSAFSPHPPMDNTTSAATPARITFDDIAVPCPSGPSDPGFPSLITDGPCRYDQLT